MTFLIMHSYLGACVNQTRRKNTKYLCVTRPRSAVGNVCDCRSRPGPILFAFFVVVLFTSDLVQNCLLSADGTSTFVGKASSRHSRQLLSALSSAYTVGKPILQTV